MKTFKIIILFLLILLTDDLNAQSKKIDSLMNVVSTTKDDSTLIFAYSDLSDIYQFNMPDSSIYWANKALLKAKKINYPKGILYLHNNIGIAFIIKGSLDSAFQYFEKMRLLAQDFKNPDYEIKALINQGIVLQKKGDFLSTEDVYNAALEKATQVNDTNNIITCRHNLALLYARTGRTEKALDLYLIILKEHEQTHNTSGQANTLVNIGTLFSKQKDFDKAIEYYNKSLPLYESINHQEGVNTVYGNKASSYSESQQLDSAEYYIIKAVDLSRERGSLNSLAKYLGTHSQILQDRGDYQQAIEIGKEALEIKRKLGMKPSMTYNYSTLSAAYRGLADYQTSNLYTDSVQQYARQFGDNRNLAYAYDSYSKNYEEIGNFKKALEYHKLYKAMNDSIFEEGKTKTINELEIAYESEKKEKQNNLLTAENNLHKAELKTKNTQIIFLIIIFVLAVGIGFIWYLAHNRAIKQKHRIQLGKQNIEAQEQIIREVSSMLHTDMGSVLSGLILKLQSKDPEKKLQEESKQLQDIYSRIRKMSHILALPSFVQSNIEDEIHSHINTIKTDGLEVNSEIYSAKGWKDVDSKTQQNIYRIAQELFTNSLKHAKASKIDIQISRADNQIFLAYEDNGTGYDPEKIQKNLGYKTEIEDRTMLMNGELSDNSRPNYGANLMISFPVKTSQ